MTAQNSLDKCIEIIKYHINNKLRQDSQNHTIYHQSAIDYVASQYELHYLVDFYEFMNKLSSAPIPGGVPNKITELENSISATNKQMVEIINFKVCDDIEIHEKYVESKIEQEQKKNGSKLNKYLNWK